VNTTNTEKGVSTGVHEYPLMAALAAVTFWGQVAMCESLRPSNSASKIPAMESLERSIEKCVCHHSEGEEKPTPVSGM
jgi:hypothetical protein